MRIGRMRGQRFRQRPPKREANLSIRRGQRQRTAQQDEGKYNGKDGFGSFQGDSYLVGYVAFAPYKPCTSVLVIPGMILYTIILPHRAIPRNPKFRRPLYAPCTKRAV